MQTEFPDIRGFSACNIWNMKSFYEFYAKNEKLPPLVAEIGWTQDCLILEKCKDKPKIEYYLRKTKEMGWSKTDFIDKINKNHFENQALAQNNFVVTVSPELKASVVSTQKNEQMLHGLYENLIKCRMFVLAMPAFLSHPTKLTLLKIFWRFRL